MFCLLQGPCEVIVKGENLSQYPESVQRVASQAVSYFGTDNYRDSNMYLGTNFPMQSLLNLLNREEIEETRFRIVPTGDSKREYNITSPHLYPDESVLMVVKDDNATLSHRIDRLD